MKPDPAKFYLSRAEGVKSSSDLDGPDLKVPFCRAHHCWPCYECGTRHFDECKCDFCVSPAERAHRARRREEREVRKVSIRAQIKSLQQQLAELGDG